MLCAYMIKTLVHLRLLSGQTPKRKKYVHYGKQAWSSWQQAVCHVIPEQSQEDPARLKKKYYIYADRIKTPNVIPLCSNLL